MTAYDYTNFNEDTLESMPLYELRIIGRTLGVKSPTSMKKGDLISSICETIAKEGLEKKEEKIERKAGRPPKTPGRITLRDSGDINDSREKKLNGEEEYALLIEKPIKNAILKNVTSTVDKEFTDEPTELEKKQYKRVYDSAMQKKPAIKRDYTPTQPTQQVNADADKKPTENEEQPASGNPQQEELPLELKEGVLEIMPDGYGFLRAHNYEGGEKDAYIAAQKIKKCGLRKGDWIKAEARKICDNRPAGVVNVLEVNDRSPETAFKRKNFDYLTPIYPDSRFRLEIDGEKNDLAIRSIDLVAPIGKGQRAMIVSPPKAGKTTLLKKVANSISVNYPSAHLIVLLIDERPEEVTDMQRSIKGEVVYSTFDEMPEHHTKAAELVLERAKRLVELGEDVVILMDSLTRLARAYNLTIAPTGRTLSGGIDPGALHSPKRFFGAARNIENGGSLTIIATALIDTGSRMDDVIYEEFKGTGNMEIHLDRRLTEKRIFPAIDLNRSGTRREELLLTQKELETVWGMRRMLNAGDGGDASEVMINELIKTKTNKEFMEQIDMKIKIMQDKGYWKK